MKYTFGFIGAGNMGSALCTAAAENNTNIKIGICDKIEKKSVLLSDRFPNVTCTDTKDIVKNSEYIFIGVKPSSLKALSDEINPPLTESYNTPIFVSMCAGTTIKKINELFGIDLPVIRIMPNTPVAVGKGLVLYCRNSYVSDAKLNFFADALLGAGELDEIDESKIDAASAVTGCGPAFAYIFIEALADGAVECGISRDKAIKYASQMLLGSAQIILKTGSHPAVLKDAVCSPAGTTIAGVRALEERGFRGAVINAVTSAYKKTLNLK